MKILATLFFLISLAGSARPAEHHFREEVREWRNPNLHAGPGPEMSAGVLGMTLAAGVLYLIKRRNRT